MTDYWLGVLTVPALGLLLVALVRIYDAANTTLGRFGISWEFKIRDTSAVNDYTLRHDIWWERSFGLVFTGGWYREKPTYMQPDRAIATRWVGIGRPDGPVLMVFHARDLGEAAS